MENPETEETLTQTQPTPAKKRRRGWPFWTMIGVLALVVIGVTSGFLGYFQGIRIRTEAADSQVHKTLEEQFRLGAQELAEGQNERARQRFEYILRIEPNFPGAQQGLAESLMRLNSTATPTPQPTATPQLPTSTPDMRAVDEKYQQAQTALSNKSWTEVIDTLLAIRKSDPIYNAVDIDGMLWLALRNRGGDKIMREADLEGGLYDLALAESFGPLDVEAQGYQTWARLYITGASFWEINWKETINYFSQVAPMVPNLRDGSNWTATERYRLASIYYAAQLFAAEDGCGAVENFDIALTMGALVDDKGGTYDQMYNDAVNMCGGQPAEGEGEGGAETEAPPTEVVPTAEVTPPSDELPPAEGTPAADGQ